ncbi:hypothetical protein [Halorussus caseinilyticus]|uniref:Uncharacterized protein n=1 Tax=Halorussus caseinilyticus TaxID=3034025 RepID=A0ABD5WSG8_9EURY|nr:hypothetical protein [Halorussus sp. DT72]
MTPTDRTDEYERIARETTWQVVTRLAEDATVAADETASAVYRDGDLSAEQVERMRQTVFDLRYATEEYLARFCAETDPWADDGRTPSWRPTGETPTWYPEGETSRTDAERGSEERNRE